MFGLVISEVFSLICSVCYVHLVCSVMYLHFGTFILVGLALGTFYYVWFDLVGVINLVW